MATVAWAATDDVAMANTGETLVPAATVTEAGTVTRGSLLDRFTTAFAGAGPFIVTLFAVVERPPITDAGDRVTESGVSGLTVRIELFFAPL